MCDADEFVDGPDDALDEDGGNLEGGQEHDDDADHTNDDNDDFVVGDSDEDNEDVLMKLNPAPRERFAIGEDSSDGKEDAIAIQRKQLRKRLDTEMDDAGDDGTAVAGLDSEDEEDDELAFRLMDDWASTNKNNAWDNEAWDNNVFDNSPRQEDVAKFGDGTMVRGIREKQVDEEIQSSSNSDPKKAGKKRRKEDSDSESDSDESKTPKRSKSKKRKKVELIQKNGWSFWS